MKPTLLENYEEAIVVEKDLRTIGVIKDDEPAKNSRDTNINSQEMVSKGREKEENDIENLTRLVKNLTIEVCELKQRKTDTSTSSHPPRQRQGSIS